jgi:serine/threonine protein kinase
MYIFVKNVEKILLSLLLGVYVLHFEGIIHRDIKPANIFVDDNVFFCLGFFFFLNIKHYLGDFGLSLRIEDTSLKEEKGIIGTLFVCLLFLFIFLNE